MARNEEKALSLFSKWDTFKKQSNAEAPGRRPFLASECESVQEAEKWRRELVRDVTKKISALSNAALGEHRIREMNDEVNKMMRQKHHWEVRIKELGGDVAKTRQFYDIDGKELPGAPGYKYYGAAKQLPGVRELFSEKEDELKTRKNKRTRGDMYKNVTPDYYGYRDDDDGILVQKEGDREKELQALAIRQHSEMKAALLGRIQSQGRTGGAGAGSEGGLGAGAEGLTAAEMAVLEDSDDEAEVQLMAASANIGNMGTDGPSASESAQLQAHVSVPSQEAIQALLLEEKRKALLERLLVL
ncbi:Isy1-like splicing factor [Ochromonadaceae sp. CCMP2298]|nr:Isy1-like splicing factor [Ochromonadaceae sp. CCMP2298]|mmetsp:Transcript_33421/g.73623  ORF Transcript_33421/g.73623 Transcript_33421/m.73623 type:complete len:301 (+) Transcript_33421:43-945(+)